MARALKVCSQPGCPELTASGRCAEHERQADRARGSRHERGYGKAHEARFRRGVLTAHPICQCTNAGPHDHASRCYRASEHADHWPLDRRTLVLQGRDANDPRYGRGLCARCHAGETAVNQPGGWNIR